MKRLTSLRTQMFGLMALLVIVQSIGLLFATSISKVYSRLDDEGFRMFNNSTSLRGEQYNQSIGDLILNMTDETTNLTAHLNSLSERWNIVEKQMYFYDDIYKEAADYGTEAVVKLLQKNYISGAFFVINRSNANKDDSDLHSAIYIRNSAPTRIVDAENYVLEIGPIHISRQHQISTSINWDLDIQITDEKYYNKPIDAVIKYMGSEIERYGYWSAPTDILKDGQKVVTYTMPILDKYGRPFGVLGAEISMSLFNQHYLPNRELPYPNSFYAISSFKDNRLDLSWFIPSGPLSEVHLPQINTLDIKSVKDGLFYETDFDSLGEMYCSAYPIVMYSQNSPFYDESWTLLGFVPKHSLHETSSDVRLIFLITIALTTAIALLASLLLTVITTRKIVGLSKYVRKLSINADMKFIHTGIREIDDLTSAVEKLNRSVINASKTTSKILKMTLLPIGGFEISYDSDYVVITEYIYNILDIEQGRVVTREEWNRLYRDLTKNPVQGYKNEYRVIDNNGVEKYLRILETRTDSGKVGVLLDVTKDVRDRERLAQELDFDSLTQLYNRMAFKRKVNECIRDNPDKKGALIFSDLDNLKYINDTFGHDMGDRLIIRAGEMFYQFEKYGGIVSRISGDEFAVYLHGFDSLGELRKIIYEQYYENSHFYLHTHDGVSHKIRCSSGIAFYPTDSDNVTDLLKLSDFAMYEAKHSQKGTIIEFNRDSYTRNSYLLDSSEAINRILDEGLIHFVFQPIVDLKTGEIYAYEALMRPLLDNFKSPLEVLKVAAVQSKLNQLERVVILKAFEIVKNHISILDEKKVFINSIPNQSLSESDLSFLKDNYKEIFQNIVIEITEAENENSNLLQRKLDFIKYTGMKIAVDDYGSGYSNEMRVLSLRPDIVKVDIGLISNIDSNTDKQQLVSNLISFCHPKGIKVIAEGVERKEELITIIKLGIDYVQGYYIGKPNFELISIDDKIKKEILYLNSIQNY